MITAEDDDPVLKFIPPPELHLLIGITTHLFKNLEREFGELADEWLNSLNLKMDHRGQFNGNTAKKLIQNANFLLKKDKGELFSYNYLFLKGKFCVFLNHLLRFLFQKTSMQNVSLI